jgi:hypothetical protein
MSEVILIFNFKVMAKEMGTDLKFSTAFHPQMDGQLERTYQILEDMLQAYVLNFKRSWI